MIPHARSAWGLEILSYAPHALKPAPPPSTAATPKENTPCISDLAGVKFFLKKERVFFGALPSKYSGKGGSEMRGSLEFARGLPIESLLA